MTEDTGPLLLADALERVADLAAMAERLGGEAVFLRPQGDDLLRLELRDMRNADDREVTLLAVE